MNDLKNAYENRLSLIVPVLNEADTLPVLVNNLKQINADETIIVDGGSSDDSVCFLQAYDGAFLQSASGRSGQMNAGAAKSTYEILLFLHADTALNSSHIEDIRMAMRDSEIVGGRFDIRLSGRHPAFRLIEFMINLRSRLSGISTGDQAMFVRREVFEKMGGFPDQALMEDVEFSRRLKKQGKIACLRRKIVTSSRRWEQHGIVRTVLLMWRLRLLYWLGISPEGLAAMYREAR
ncbi:MAG: TIGR04283 family arsenosugar biosynthesis glycosyltransferase [Mariprofundaceae bacterium]